MIFCTFWRAPDLSGTLVFDCNWQKMHKFLILSLRCYVSATMLPEIKVSLSGNNALFLPV